MQYTVGSDELKADTEHLFEVIKCDKDHKCLSNLKPYTVVEVVDEALHTLYKTQRWTESISEVYNDACMVISLILHWLVITLCKKLMQLMIPEALATIKNSIPDFYIRYYLEFQEHFSLKLQIERHLDGMRKQTRYIFSCAWSIIPVSYTHLTLPTIYSV